MLLIRGQRRACSTKKQRNNCWREQSSWKIWCYLLKRVKRTIRVHFAAAAILSIGLLSRHREKFLQSVCSRVKEIFSSEGVSFWSAYVFQTQTPIKQQICDFITTNHLAQYNDGTAEVKRYRRKSLLQQLPMKPILIYKLPTLTTKAT